MRQTLHGKVKDNDVDTDEVSGCYRGTNGQHAL